jgi:hypothetical protein
MVFVAKTSSVTVSATNIWVTSEATDGSPTALSRAERADVGLLFARVPNPLDVVYLTVAQ